MLAGRVKLKNFLLAAALVGAGAGAFLVVGGVWYAAQPHGGPATTASPTSTLTRTVAAAPNAPAGDTMSEAVRDVLSHRNDALPVDKVKDISPGKSWKINLYQDPGHTTVNRAKLDLDRDEKWDEKFTFNLDGTVTREVSTQDDENYGPLMQLEGDSWATEGGADVAAPAAPDPTAPAAAPGELAARPVDTDVMAYKGKNLGTDKLKDVTGGKPYKVNVYQEAGQSTASRVKIDLDRDDKWDEKITFKADEISREVAPADDENYTEHWSWTGSAWKRTN